MHANVDIYSYIRVHKQASWSISKTSPSTISFDDDVESEIVATFNISSAQANNDTISVNFLEFDTCNTTRYNGNLTANVGGALDTGNDNYKEVPVGIAINKKTISTSGLERWINDTHTELKFCTRVDLLTDSPISGLETSVAGPLADIYARSVSYIKVMYQLDIDATSNFEVSIAVEEADGDESDVNQSASVSFAVNACQCTVPDKVCVSENYPAMNQNEVLNVCVYPIATDVIIKKVMRYEISQADMVIAFITPESTNSLTTVADEGQAKVSISTVLISAFFINPRTITASGLVVLSFADTDGARQLKHFDPMRNDRLLQTGE